MPKHKKHHVRPRQRPPTKFKVDRSFIQMAWPLTILRKRASRK